ncbi:MAG: hypothetical protein NXI14_03820 [bacterium]|nr:hypothetical protein [bacterium]
MNIEFDPEIAKARRWLLACQLGLMTEPEVVARVDELIRETDSPSEALIALSMREDLSQIEQLDFTYYPCTPNEASYIAGLLLESRSKWLNDPLQLSQVTHKVAMQFLDPEENLHWVWISDEIDMYLDSRTSARVRESMFLAVFDELARIAVR